MQQRVCMIYIYDADFVALWMYGDTLLYKRYSMMVDLSNFGEPEFDLRDDEDSGSVPTDSPAPEFAPEWFAWAIEQFGKFSKLDMEDYTLIDPYWR